MPRVIGRKWYLGNGLKPLSSKVHRNLTRSLYHKTLLLQNVKEHTIPPAFYRPVHNLLGFVILFLDVYVLNSAAKLRKNPDSHQRIIGIFIQEICFLTYPRRRNNKRNARDKKKSYISYVKV